MPFDDEDIRAALAHAAVLMATDAMPADLDCTSVALVGEEAAIDLEAGMPRATRHDGARRPADGAAGWIIFPADGLGWGWPMPPGEPDARQKFLVALGAHDGTPGRRCAGAGDVSVAGGRDLKW